MQTNPLGAKKGTEGFVLSVRRRPALACHGDRLDIRRLVGGADRSRNVAERRVGVRANGANSGQANDDNQGQHDGVFNRGRAIFGYQELLYFLRELLHLSSSF